MEHVLLTIQDFGLFPEMDYEAINKILDHKFREIAEKSQFFTLVLKPEDLRSGPSHPRTARIEDIKYSMKLVQHAHRVSVVYQDEVNPEVYHQRDLKNRSMGNPNLHAMTAKGLRELRDPAKRDHPSLRWGQAVVNKFMTGIHTELFHANDEKTHQIVEQMIKDYQLDGNSPNAVSHHDGSQHDSDPS